MSESSASSLTDCPRRVLLALVCERLVVDQRVREDDNQNGRRHVRPAEPPVEASLAVEHELDVPAQIARACNTKTDRIRDTHADTERR